MAINSNGLIEEFVNNVTNLLNFSFLPSSSQTQMQLPLPVMDTDNFQLYSYALPPVGINTEGNYTLAINSTFLILYLKLITVVIG